MLKSRPDGSDVSVINAILDLQTDLLARQGLGENVGTEVRVDHSSPPHMSLSATSRAISGWQVWTLVSGKTTNGGLASPYSVAMCFSALSDGTADEGGIRSEFDGCWGEFLDIRGPLSRLKSVMVTYRPDEVAEIQAAYAFHDRHFSSHDESEMVASKDPAALVQAIRTFVLERLPVIG